MDGKEMRIEPSNARWARVLLAISLAANFMVIGAVGATVFLHQENVRTDKPSRESRFKPYIRALSKADRAVMGRELRKEMQPVIVNAAPKAAQRQAVLETLKAVPFDPSAFEQAVNEQQSVAEERVRRGRALFFREIQSMSPAERKRYALRLERAFAPGRRTAGRHD